MLYSIESDSEVVNIPHKDRYARWRAKLSATQFENIVRELTDRIDGDEIMTSSWIPGKDWRGTVFQPIYEACDQNETDAARFFGLILWVTLMQHQDWWSFGRYERDGIPIEGLTYFRIAPPR